MIFLAFIDVKQKVIEWYKFHFCGMCRISVRYDFECNTKLCSSWRFTVWTQAAWTLAPITERGTDGDRCSGCLWCEFNVCVFTKDVCRSSPRFWQPDWPGCIQFNSFLWRSSPSLEGESTFTSSVRGRFGDSKRISFQLLYMIYKNWHEMVTYGKTSC